MGERARRHAPMCAGRAGDALRPRCAPAGSTPFDVRPDVARLAGVRNAGQRELLNRRGRVRCLHTHASASAGPGCEESSTRVAFPRGGSSACARAACPRRAVARLSSRTPRAPRGTLAPSTAPRPARPPRHPDDHARHRLEALEPLSHPARRRHHVPRVRDRADVPALSQDGEGDGQRAARLEPAQGLLLGRRRGARRHRPDDVLPRAAPAPGHRGAVPARARHLRRRVDGAAPAAQPAQAGREHRSARLARRQDRGPRRSVRGPARKETPPRRSPAPASTSRPGR